MGKRTRRRLIRSAIAASAALVMGATSIHAQHDFIAHPLQAPPPAAYDDVDDLEPARHRQHTLSHAFLRSSDGAGDSILPTQPLDYEALASGVTPVVVLHGQMSRGIDWLRLEGAAEQGTERTTSILRAQGLVRGSLSASFAASGISMAAAAEAMKAFEQEIDLGREVRGGDRFAVLVERSFGANGRRVGEDRVIWAELRLYDKRTVAIHRFRPEGGAEQFWLANGLSVAKAPLKAPADESLMSSPFGKRAGPILGVRDAMHNGVDYALGPRTPIPAAAAGIVKAAEVNGGYGKWVLIDHGGGLMTAYAHLDDFAPGLEAGSRVAQGDVIGFTGDTGFSTGPHLHYEVHVDGEPVDPMTHSASVRNMLRGADLERFHAEIGQLLQDYAGTAPLARLSLR